MPRLRKTSSVPSVRSDNGTCDNTRSSRLGTPALLNLYSIVIFAVLFTPFGILVTAHRRHELLFDERVGQGFAVGMSPISASNSPIVYHTSLFAV
jgi:hypothetical protein